MRLKYFLPGNCEVVMYEGKSESQDIAFRVEVIDVNDLVFMIRPKFWYNCGYYNTQNSRFAQRYISVLKPPTYLSWTKKKMMYRNYVTRNV